MKTKNILFAAGLLATTLQVNAQVSTVLGSTKNPLKLEIDQRSPLCNGDQNGKISITIGGGKAPYYVNNAQIEGSTFEVGPLYAGNYHFDIADDSTSFVSTDITLVNPAPISVSSIVSNVTSFHGSDGSINLIVNEPNVTFVWEGISLNNNNTLAISEEDQTGLSAGHYGVSVTNEIGCSSFFKFEITQPNAPLVNGVSNPQTVGGTMPIISNVNVYPNPSSGHVTLEADKAVRSAVLTNDLGIVLEDINFTTEGKLTSMDLNPGVYTLISIDENGNRSAERIVIR
jgi:formylmethanofuran dehydrogenase subunit D